MSNIFLPCKIEHIGYLLSPCVFPFPMARILLWSSLLSLVLCSYNRDYVGLVGLVSEWIPIWQGPHTNALSKPGSVSFVIFVMIALNVFVFAFYLYDFQCGTHTHICQASFAEWSLKTMTQQNAFGVICEQSNIPMPCVSIEYEARWRKRQKCLNSFHIVDNVNLTSSQFWIGVLGQICSAHKFNSVLPCLCLRKVFYFDF